MGVVRILATGTEVTGLSPRRRRGPILREVIGSPATRGRHADLSPNFRHVGFTLIEVLVVVAIAGIVLAYAAVNLFPSNEEIARRESSLLALDIEAARDDAWFGGQPKAVSLDQGRFREMRLATDRTWESMAAREKALFDGVRIDAVAIDGMPVKLDQPLVFLPDGFGTPFRIALTIRGVARAIEGDAAGAVRAVAP
jgi:general secretion pathway protein H